jgi:outer membrane murein-binding lipoprotein Lpp
MTICRYSAFAIALLLLASCSDAEQKARDDELASAVSDLQDSVAELSEKVDQLVDQSEEAGSVSAVAPMVGQTSFEPSHRDLQMQLRNIETKVSRIEQQQMFGQ